MTCRGWVRLVKQHPNVGRKTLRNLCQDILSRNPEGVYLDDLLYLLKRKKYSFNSEQQFTAMFSILRLELSEDGTIVNSKKRRRR